MTEKDIKVEDIINKIGKLTMEELGVLAKFLIFVTTLNEEDQKIVVDLFKLLEKKIDENYVRKEEK